MGGPFARLKLDCADAHYALIAYFARENKLPVSFNNGNITNNTTKFDSLGSADQKLAAFMDHLRANLGTEALVHHDTIPPQISDLQPGDLYMWKIGSGSAVTRHTYIIKKVNANGTFEMLYSTKANAKNAGALKTKSNFMPPHPPRHRGGDANHWGFRRFKRAHEAAISQENIGRASFEQYEWARSMSNAAFFDTVQSVTQTRKQRPAKVIKDLVHSVCSQVLGRVASVNEGLEYRRKLGGACMDYADYDDYSTPGRDSGIMGDYNRLRHKLVQYRDAGLLGKVPKGTRNMALAVFSSNLSDQDRRTLYRKCPVKFGPAQDHWIDLNSFREALFDGDVSFHPNDSLLSRWGFDDGPRTRCKTHYGYPSS